ncbi:S-formylglutathione hydrolase [Neptuniibacter sp. CAU 1671]|uniref:S-formylglutathione hydrolase n=1 Tax=Neptuniibacter sp. CAU 1671 TaxID=3032593 RepID=UPI0023DCA9A7|nr:S-formylglutathione hydrolase [Neptuniibacter sp. CAU 1671]MDF2181616.1 S-formylglutathione hydrolase [Neptuniibacter sp. CAU 1671]
MSLELKSNYQSFGGRQQQYLHQSEVLHCQMRFAIYLPPQAEVSPVPVVYWLSGLTCTDENFIQKAGAQRVASELGLAIVCPDTSPRGEGVADDPEGAYDLGLGASFYVNATQSPWKAHYQMYDYVVHELPALIEANFNVQAKRAIAGHSMGGHGALVIGLRNQDRYSSVSAFSPIANPTQCPWGQKALTAYLGTDTADWAEYDASRLLSSMADAPPMLVDQGEADEFLATQLHPQALQQAAAKAGHDLTYRLRPGYDHSYYFIASFIEDHLRFHARYF